MALSAEWRTNGDFDAILIVDDGHIVRDALAATSTMLSRLLTQMGDIGAWRGEYAVDGERRDPAAWGSLVLSRADTGEIITMDPERFWNGVYLWFRSRGVDYDTVPG